MCAIPSHAELRWIWGMLNEAETIALFQCLVDTERIFKLDYRFIATAESLIASGDVLYHERTFTIG